MADTVESSFADSGCGITPDEKEKLFLPYFSTKGRGTGLGLAIVSHILAEHDASIRVEDNKPCGARFTVEVPALLPSRDRRAATCRRLSAAGRTRMKPPRILIVDDEPGIRQSLSGVLRGRGLSTRVRSRAAKRASTRWRGIDLRTGAARHLAARDRRPRDTEPHPGDPAADRPVVVMISGHGTIETAVRATKLGAFDFLEKPLSIERVLLVVKNALEHRRLRLENEQLRESAGSASEHRRRQRADEGAAAATGADGGHQRPRADLRRKRHGQGTGGARAARHEPAGVRSRSWK